MRRRALVATLLATAASPARAGAPWWLVSEAEAARDRAALHHPATRGLTPAGVPRIELERPNTETGLRCPFSVRVRFVPAPDARIVASSFRATYGWLGLDITQRLLQHATLSQDGLEADDVNAPSGEHRIDISIADTLGRVGSRTLRFTIV